MEGSGDGIISGPVFSVCKLVWVKCRGETGFDVVQYKSLKAFCNQRCNWSVITEVADGGIFVDRDYGN